MTQRSELESIHERVGPSSVAVGGSSVIGCPLVEDSCREDDEVCDLFKSFRVSFETICLVNVGPLYPRDLAYYVILFSPHPPTQGNEDTTVI